MVGGGNRVSPPHACARAAFLAFFFAKKGIGRRGRKSPSGDRTQQTVSTPCVLSRGKYRKIFLSTGKKPLGRASQTVSTLCVLSRGTALAAQTPNALHVGPLPRAIYTRFFSRARLMASFSAAASAASCVPCNETAVARVRPTAHAKVSASCQTHS
jgi:hypothetical protein